MSELSLVKRPFGVVSLLSLSGMMGLTGGLPAIATPLQVAQVYSAPTQYNYLFVNSNRGIDTADGTARSPLKTITRALQIVQPNTIILLAPGTYSAQTGEAFPLQMKPGTTIKGEPRDRGQNVVIQGSGIFLSRTFARQSVTILGANQAGLTGVTVSNPNAQGYGVWIESTSPVISDNTFTGSGHDGASVVGSSAPVLRNNYFYENGANGITIYGTSRPELHDNIFEKTGFGINVAQNAAPRIIGNRITQNKDGIVIQGKAAPILRNNVIDGNLRDGMVAIAQSRPNLGTSSDPGNNTFTGNGQFDLNAQKSIQKIPAFGNQITGSKTIGRLDFSNTSATAEAPVSVASAKGYRQPLPAIAPAPAAPLPALFNRSVAPSIISPPVSPSASPAMGSASSPVPAIAVSPALPRGGRVLPLPKQPKAQSVSAEIPVPSPARLSPIPARSALQPNPVMPRFGSNGAIDIPVPPPESSVAPRQALAMQSSVSRPEFSPNPISASGTLPVPKGSIPLGRTAGTSVKVWRGAPVSPNRVAPPSSQMLALGLRYRVVVQASGEGEQAQIQSVAPGAFPVFRGSQNVMQAGVFSDRTKADELIQMLVNQGLRATIEQL